ncbi:type IV secretion system protein [Candidatus Parcubacteria bacterium]|nr:type IV secretion system protein [Candidatus Parcubacteria bacterium]
MKRTRFQKLLQVFAKPILGFVIIMSVISPFGPLTAHAQVSPTISTTLPVGIISAVATGPDECRAKGGTWNGVFGGGCSFSNPNTRVNETFNALTAGDDIGCLNGAGSVTNTIALCLTNVIYVVTVGIGSAFAYVSAMFFNFAVAISLNGFSYALQFINGGWTVARDIANLFFILILVFIAFTVMLNAETAGTMRLLVGVIFIALIINFSFFITRVVIDMSNIFAIQFYNAIEADPLSKSLANVTTATGVLGSLAASGSGLAKSDAKDLTASIMNVLQVQNLFSTGSFQKYMQGKPSGFTTFITLTFIYVAAAILLWMLTIAFVVNGVKFLMRVVVLWLVIIASPLAFIAATLPQTRSWFNQWRDVLVSYSLYPIVFMFIFLILTVVLKQLGNCPPVGSAGVAPSGCLVGDIFTSINSLSSGGANPNFFVWLGAVIANIAIRLGFIISLLYIGMKVADSIGVMGAEFASNMGNRAGGWFKGAVKYGPGWMAGATYRRTAGAGAAALDKSLAGTKWANEKGVWGTLGYRLRKNVLAPMKATSVGTVASSYKERQEYLDTRKKEMTSNLRDRDNKQIVEKAVETPHLLSDKEISRIQNFSKREYEQIDPDKLAKIGWILDESQQKTVDSIDKFTEAQKEAIREMSEPIFKSQKIITDTLRKLDTNLRTVRTPNTANLTRKGEIVSAAEVAQMRTEVSTQMANVRTRIRAAAPGADNTELHKDLDQLHNATEALNNLDKHLRNTKAHADRVANTVKAK